jgi:hypothetical protein
MITFMGPEIRMNILYQALLKHNGLYSDSEHADHVNYSVIFKTSYAPS